MKYYIYSIFLLLFAFSCTSNENRRENSRLLPEPDIKLRLINQKENIDSLESQSKGIWLDYSYFSIFVDSTRQHIYSMKECPSCEGYTHYKHYFDQGGKTFAFEEFNLTEFNSVDTTDIIIQINTKFYDSDLIDMNLFIS